MVRGCVHQEALNKCLERGAGGDRGCCGLCVSFLPSSTKGTQKHLRRVCKSCRNDSGCAVFDDNWCDFNCLGGGGKSLPLAAGLVARRGSSSVGSPSA